MFLDRIVTRTRADLEQRKMTQPLAEVQRLAAAQPDPRDLLAALKNVEATTRPPTPASQVRLIAEVKRASPSRGMLAPHLDPVDLARTYEANGAAALSVLTEPHFFLGSPDDLTAIKQAASVPVLRKDFIVDEYQVYEARAWGADAILLICALLDDAQLRYLLGIAHEQRMRCLVEVHDCEEARRAVEAGAMIIGVNSRDLETFQVNPSLIRELRPLIPADRVVVAESGIHTDADARRLARYDIQAMLVGESLVVADDVPGQIRALLRGANESVQVKICGLRIAEHLRVATAAGADLLGLMFYEPSSRYIDPRAVRALLEDTGFTSHIQNAQALPDLVGVFVNKEASFINDIVDQLGLHFVQLHGDEPPGFCRRINRPVIKAIHMGKAGDQDKVRAYGQAAWRILLDTPSIGWGGSGATHDWNIARAIARELPILLAGGLKPDNVSQAIRQVQPWGVDVSSGVETCGVKDAQKIQAFIENVRHTERLLDRT